VTHYVHMNLTSSLHSYSVLHFILLKPRLLISTLFPYTTLFRSDDLRFGAELLQISHHVASLSEPYKRSHPDGIEFGMGPLVGLRSEEHTSELQSRFDLVCRLLLEKKNNENTDPRSAPT